MEGRGKQALVSNATRRGRGDLLMKLRDRTFEKTTCRLCNHTKSKLILEESYGCDWCEKPIDDLIEAGHKNTKYSEYLSITVFSNHTESKSYEFCSWKCVFAKLRTIKCNYFVSLPYVTYEKTTPGQTPEDLFRCLRK